MAWVQTDFAYMPPGSYAIRPDRSVIFLQPVPDDLKERFMADFARLKREADARHKQGIIKDTDI